MQRVCFMWYALTTVLVPNVVVLRFLENLGMLHLQIISLLTHNQAK